MDLKPVTSNGNSAPRLQDLKIKIFADGADGAIREVGALPYIAGFTTNPTLMCKAGVKDYRSFADEMLKAVAGRPISFEVLSEEMDEIEGEAREIASWGENIYVKVPATNTRGESTRAVVRRLTRSGVKVNVTAMMTLARVEEMAEALAGGAPSFVSIFAGRIADSGRDPIPIMKEAKQLLLHRAPQAELLWASPREVLNLFQADEAGCDIITVTLDLLKKLTLVGKDLDDFALETVKMFYDDGKKAGLSLKQAPVAVTR